MSQSRVLRMRNPALVFSLGTAGVAVLGSVDPNQPGHYPTCPFLWATGLWCPGCGSLRAIHALTELDLSTALARNPLTVIACGWLLWVFFRWTYRCWTQRGKSWLAPAWLLYSLAALVVIYGVARNFPGATWLSPA